MNRRALLGVGVFGASVVATLGASALGPDRPSPPTRDQRRGRLDGLASEPIRRLLQHEEVDDALRRSGVRLDDIARSPLGETSWDLDGIDYFIPALATLGGGPAQTRLPLFTSPLVLHARPAFAATLAERGLLQARGTQTFVDAAGLLRSNAPFAIADPMRSDAAWLFAGLAMSVLGGVAPAEGTLRSRMNEDDTPDSFMEADPTAAPARIGFEADLYAWDADDPGRWGQLQASRPDALPVTLFLRPTLYATWTFVGVRPASLPLATALLSPLLQQLAQHRFGLRGPLRQAIPGESYRAAGRLPPAPADVAPSPDYPLVQALAGRLGDGA